MDLGLRQKDVAARLEVCVATALGWEKWGREPEVRHYPAIIVFLGYRPWAKPASIGKRLLAARRVLGLSQKALARGIGVDPTTIRNWEAELRRPKGPYRVLLERLFSQAKVE